MANGYTAGSVSARIELNTKEFDAAIKKIKEEVQSLKNEMTSVKGVSKIQQELDSLKKSNDNLKKTIDELRKRNENLAKSNSKATKSIKQQTEELNRYNEAVVKVDRSQKKAFSGEIKTLDMKYAEKGIKRVKSLGNELKKVSNYSKRAFQQTDIDRSGFTRASVALGQVGKEARKTQLELVKMRAELDVLRTKGYKAPKFIDDVSINNIKTATQQFSRFEREANKAFNSAANVADRYNRRLERMSAELRKYYLENEKYYASVGAMSTKYWNQIRNSTVGNNKVWNSDKTWSTAAYNKQTVGMSSYYGNINKINKALTEQTQRTQKLKTAQQQLWSKYHTTNLNTYKANMGEINKKLAEQTTNVRQAGRGLTSFNNGVVKTAHSGRILSNTLYQIRGALLSLKMIFTAMGGMALWGFATDVAESVKETVTAKNEMEAQLKQNSKVDTAGIQYFRKELDKLPKTFQKVNKYAVGETVSSIGLEFNLTAKQMKDALPIVTMIQSEYVRAGRKTSEAALAVKDILQGEFQRLSRETGVGKEELVAYGWDEDKTNIDGLLKALQKAALDRHWDIFAKKATSLNDVITITKSRFSELGADIVDSVTPMIVGGFNTLIDTITNIQNAFNGLNSFWQNTIFFGGGLSLFTGILTALPMITKGMGLAEIATIGWGKSILTAVFNLNKAEVATFGFRKALAAVITGTSAHELATVRSSKAILGRVLGVNQAALAERGLMTALVESTAKLKGHTLQISYAELTAMNFRQKLTYLVGNISLADAKTVGWTGSIKAIITSTKLWRIALLGVTGVGLVYWISSVAMWTDIVKKRVEKYNDVLATGKEKIREAKDTVTALTNRQAKQKSELDGLTEGTDKYNKKLQELNLTTSNLQTANHNVVDLESAYKLAKSIKKESEELAQTNEGMITRGLNATYSANGVKNVEKYGKNYQQLKYVRYDILKSEKESYKFQYASLQHINEQVGLMEKAGVKEKDRIKYITEYSTKAEEAAEHLKQFNQGDMTAGIYYVLDRISLMWIDLWNNQSFLKFWDSLNKTWKDLKPTAWAIKDALQGIAETMLEFASTDTGRWITAFSGLTLGVAALGWKFRGVLGTLKDLGTTIWSRIKDFKGLKKSAEEASEKMGQTGTTTGGTVGKTPTKYGSWGELGGAMKQDFMANARSFANNATKIAMAMGYLTVAIATLSLPMIAIAAEGELFKRIEPQVKKGIEGLKLVAPTIIAMMTPMAALMFIMDKYKVTSSQLMTGFKRSAEGIALAIVLVTEAILLLNAPLLMLGVLGSVYGKIKSNVNDGIEAIKATNDALTSLAPWIPVFAIGIGLVAVAMTGVGNVAIFAAAAGIALGLALVAEAVVGLALPLEAIASLGENYSKNDLANVKEGAKIIEATSEGLMSLETGLGAMAKIKWDMLAGYVADLIGVKLGIDLTDLTGEGGFFDQLETFTKEFNKIKLTPIDMDKVKTLTDSATGLDSVKKALSTVKDALKNLPNFEVDNRTTQQKYNDSLSGETTAEGITNYFEQLKQPIIQLNSFIKKFNDLEIEPVEQGQVDLIQGSASAISTINTAIENVKTAMGNAVDAQWNANVQTSGILGAGLNLLVGNAGQSSGVKAGLDELYNCVKDIMDFNTRISGLTSEGSGDTSSIEGASNMVSALETQINSLKTTLSGAVPTVKEAAKGVGVGIVDGVKEGVKGLSTVDIKTPTSTEIDDVLKYLDGQKDEFYNKGKTLGEALSDGYKDGQDMHSPGIIARSTQEEIGRVTGYFDDAINNLPQKAFTLAQSVASNFSSNFNLGGFSLPNMDSFNQTLSQVVPTVDNVKTQVSSKFSEMQSNIGISFGGIVSTTRLSLTNMQGQTTKNIEAIRTSWKGMQTALIASAENIRKQTGDKISNLKNNMADFWKKIQNPSQLIGAAGGHQGTIRRKYGGSAVKGLFAGGTSSKSPDISKDIKDYIACLITTGGNCYAGGWRFNWNKPIQDKFNGWNTHFGKYNIDNYVKVGKFHNNNFPVRGIAEIAKAYIFDTIAATSYSKYFNSNFGDDPVSALMAGAFNCWDGTNIVLALANAFGFSGSRGHGTWNGIGHVWADIPGLGIIDPTAIQQNHSFTSSAVKGYHAGGTINRNSSGEDVPFGEVNNYNGDVNVTIYADGNVEMNKRKLNKQTGKQILDILGINPATGR